MSEPWVIALAVVFLTVPANWIVRLVLRLSGHTETVKVNRAGRWIGTLERLLILVLMLAGQAAAAGLVIAAKSILRFPEISGKPASIDPEYVLVGSLTSWLIAFAAGAYLIS
jgi:hypothetical protein